MKYVVEAQSGRFWGMFDSAGEAAQWAETWLAGEVMANGDGVPNAFKVIPVNNYLD